MEQPSFASLEFQNKKRKTRREAFLERMDALIPWERLEERIRPHYPKAGRGRQPYDLSVMLRVHIVQVCYNLSDPGMEDLLYEAESVRRFVGLRLIDPLPDESTILHFRHLWAHTMECNLSKPPEHFHCTSFAKHRLVIQVPVFRPSCS